MLTIAVGINEKPAAAEREIQKVQRDSVFQEVLENGYRLVCIKPEQCEVAPVFMAIPMQRSPSGSPQVKSIGIFPPPLRVKAPAGVFRQHRRLFARIQRLVRFPPRCPASLSIANLLTQLCIWTLTPDCGKQLLHRFPGMLSRMHELSCQNKPPKF